VDRSEPGTLTDGTDPPVGSATVELLPIPAAQDRALVAFADGEVNRPGGARHERDPGGLVAFAKNAQGAVP
jgi:hypothetical protein